jgi:hypothetical protein
MISMGKTKGHPWLEGETIRTLGSGSLIGGKGVVGVVARFELISSIQQLMIYRCCWFYYPLSQLIIWALLKNNEIATKFEDCAKCEKKDINILIK